ncbi:MAG: hypothetical protein ACP5E2_16995, partial [Terracidiphilus sp.]
MASRLSPQAVEDRRVAAVPSEHSQAKSVHGNLSHGNREQNVSGSARTLRGRRPSDLHSSGFLAQHSVLMGKTHQTGIYKSAPQVRPTPTLKESS